MAFYSVIRTYVFFIIPLILFVNCSSDDSQSDAPPVISSISSDQGFYNDEIIITGENFGSQISNNIVSLSGIKFEVISATSSQLKIKVPFVINRTGRISVKVGSQEVVSGNEFWINTSVGTWNQFWNDRWHDGSPIESDNFIVFSERSSLSMRQQILNDAETSLIDLKSLIQYSDGDFQFRSDYESEKIHILADYNQQPFAGLAYRDGFIIRAKDSPRYDGNSERWHNVFQLEMAHVIEFLLIGAYNYRLANTVWMREGFGNYGARNHKIQTVDQLNAWRNSMQNITGKGNPIAIRVWSDFPQSVIDNNTFVDYYAFFELAVRYLLDPNGQNKTIEDLKNFYDNLGNGMAVNTAFQNNFDLNMDEFQASYWDLMAAYLAN